MIICKKIRTIFIHIPKNAGSSITQYFKSNFLESELKHWALSNQTKHETYFEIQKKGKNLSILKNFFFDASFLDFYKFAVVRNPYDRMVSLYFYLKQRHSQNLLEKNNVDSFDEFIYLLENSDSWIYNLYSTKLQLKYLVDENQIVAMNYICRFENIHQDLATVSKQIGVNIKLPHENKSCHSSYKKYYTNNTKSIVSKYYSKDLNFLNYQF